MLQSASLTRQQRNDARHVGFELNPGLFGVVLCKMFISHSVLEYLTENMAHMRLLCLDPRMSFTIKTAFIQLHILINTCLCNCYSF